MKNKFKHIMAALLALAMILSFAGCKTTRLDNVESTLPSVPAVSENTEGSGPEESKPQKPSQPEESKPQKPSQPEESKPQKPSQPEESKPQKPSQPEESKPQKPSQPEESKPQKPSQPEETKPQKPSQPEETKPQKPSQPEETKPQKPSQPEETKPQKPEKKVCYLTISCKTILDNMDQLAEGKERLVPRNGMILSRTAVPYKEGDSVFDVLKRVTREKRIHMESSFTPMYDSAYIRGIGNLYEKDCGDGSGWMYRVNDHFPNYGVSKYSIQEGDDIRFDYTCDLGRDLGQNWM